MTLLLAVNRIQFLKTEEKLLLTQLISVENEFLRLSVHDLSRMIGRDCDSKRWDPQSLWKSAEIDACTLQLKQIYTLTFWDNLYPEELREIYDPPFLLFVRGNPLALRSPRVAVVGTRQPTLRSSKAAFELGYQLADAGCAVVSGLALGIDSAAHQGALAQKGITIAVLGNGIGGFYPKSNAKTALRIIESGGALVSEYPPDEPPRKHYFPQRNRIISGLSTIVVVIEAPKGSGALITADFALEQGKELVVHQSGIDGAFSEGTRQLAQDGCPVISSAWEIVRPPEKLKNKPKEEAVSPCLVSDSGKALAMLLENELNGSRKNYYGDHL